MSLPSLLWNHGAGFDTRIWFLCEKRSLPRLSEITVSASCCLPRYLADLSLQNVAIVFIYDFHPLAVTLASKHFSTTGRPPEILQERVLWSYICQITSALKSIHSSGLACRAMEPSKILVTGRNRIRFSSCGILDLLSYDGGKNVQQFQVRLGSGTELGFASYLRVDLTARRFDQLWAVDRGASMRDACCNSQFGAVH